MGFIIAGFEGEDGRVKIKKAKSEKNKNVRRERRGKKTRNKTKNVKRRTLQSWYALEGSYGVLVDLLAGADLRAAHGGAKERGKDTEVEQPGQQRHQANDCHDGAAQAVHENAQCDENYASYNTGDAASRGSHEIYEGVHFISPIWGELIPDLFVPPV